MQKNAYPRALGFVLLFIYSALTFLIDLGTKFFFFDQALLRPPVEQWIGSRFLALAVHANFGATFNASIPIPILIIASFSFLAWGVLMFIRIPEWWKRGWTIFFAGLLVGGAAGNIFDRIHLGFVRDWILVAQISVLNLADLAIIFGCIGLLAMAGLESKTKRIPSTKKA